MIFYRQIKKTKFYFVPGIILNHSRHRKSIFWYTKTQNFMKFYKKIFGSKNHFLYKNRFLNLKNLEKTEKKRTRNHKISRVPWRRPDLQRAQIIRSQGYPFEPWVTLFPQVNCKPSFWWWIQPWSLSSLVDLDQSFRLS